jgi:hypothetical protein
MGSALSTSLVGFNCFKFYFSSLFLTGAEFSLDLDEVVGLAGEDL